MLLAFVCAARTAFAVEVNKLISFPHLFRKIFHKNKREYLKLQKSVVGLYNTNNSIIRSLECEFNIFEIQSIFSQSNVIW